jgi:hypothetical protein
MRSFPPTSPGLIGVELLIEIVIAAAYITIGVDHHRSGNWICFVYFLLATAAMALGCVAFVHLHQLLNREQPPADPEV